MNDLERRSREIVSDAEGKISPIEYIRSNVRAMHTADLVELATAYLYSQVKQRRRAHVREIEQEASSNQTAPWADGSASAKRLLVIRICAR